MDGLTGFYTELNKGVAAGARLFELADREPAIPIRGSDLLLPPKNVLDTGGLTLPAIVGDIRFEHVHFAYRPVSDAVIDSDSVESEIEDQADDASTRSDKHMADVSAEATELTLDVIKSEETCVFTGLTLQLRPGTTTGMCVFSH
jgi:ABC-type multidrug transport system fused ATPase/permease subunit